MPRRVARAGLHASGPSHPSQGLGIRFGAEPPMWCTGPDPENNLRSYSLFQSQFSIDWQSAVQSQCFTVFGKPCNKKKNVFHLYPFDCPCVTSVGNCLGQFKNSFLSICALNFFSHSTYLTPVRLRLFGSCTGAETTTLLVQALLLFVANLRLFIS